LPEGSEREEEQGVSAPALHIAAFSLTPGAFV